MNVWDQWDRLNLEQGIAAYAMMGLAGLLVIMLIAPFLYRVLFGKEDDR